MIGIVRFIRRTRKQDNERSQAKKQRKPLIYIKCLDYWEKQKKGDFVPARNKDALHMALGEKYDHPGRVRGIGGINVGTRKVYVGLDSKSLKSYVLTEDRETLKNELREELRKEFEEHLRGNFSPPKNGPKSASSARSLKFYPASLKLADAGLGSVFGADGKATVRGKQIKPRHVKVKVQVVFEEMKSAPLPAPIPENEILVLDDAVGSFVEWPIKLVMFPSNKWQENIQKKDLETRGSDSYFIKEFIPRKQVVPSLPTSLSKECLWLHTCVSLIQDAQTFEIELDGNSFYFGEDVAKIWVNKRDIEEFLSGAKLNISIIQVFIKYLEDEGLPSRVGWLCPESTSAAKIKANAEEVTDYIFKAISVSAECGDKLILAPIHQDSHWLLIGICVPKTTIYLFNSINTQGESLHVRPLVNFAFHRFRLSGGVTKRKKSL